MSVRVVCRFRPQNKGELAQGGTSIVDISDHQTVTIRGNESNHTFTFDRIFGDKSTQKEVYDDAAKPVVEDIMSGYNGTLFVYGQTSSGKTHTMQGPSIDDQELKGVIPRMINTVFDCINKADENIEFIVKASYIEIYMERIRDLLDQRKDNLKVREEKGKGVWVEGTTEVYIYREDDILEVMRTGQANRAIAETKMNAESSRSHSIFILSIQQKNLKEGSMKHGKLFLVDLAGSERANKTGAAGVTLDEAKMINKSLSSLGNVINALTDGKSTHIPYRDSKLTRVLQESLGGNSRTTLIINCSPSSYNETETVSTLRFGNRAKSIKNKAKINQERSAAELKILLGKAEKEIENLKDYIKELESVSGIKDSTKTSTNNLNNILNDQNQELVLKEKCISLEKLLFQKEQEKKELVEQLETANEQLQDKEQEIESQSHQLLKLNEDIQKFTNLSHENDLLGTQLAEVKILFDKLKYESNENQLLVEELSVENTNLKSQLANGTPGKTSSSSTTAATTFTSQEDRLKDPSLSVKMHSDEWSEKEEQLKLLQRTPSKKPSPKLPISPITIAAEVSSNSNMINIITQENETLKSKIIELELKLQQQQQQQPTNTTTTMVQNIVENGEVVQDQQQIVKEEEKEENNESIPTNTTLDEIPSEMIFQAEQLRKLLNENSEQRNQIDGFKSENKKLTIRLNNIEEETRLRMEEELNLLREQTNQKLSEFGALKESLLRDLENRCQKVIDLELVLDEFQDRVATLQERLKRATKGDSESAMIQLKLDEITQVKHQLVKENQKLVLEQQRSAKQLTLRNEHILSLENTIKESQDRQYKLALNYESATTELTRIRNEYQMMVEGKKPNGLLIGGGPNSIINTNANSNQEGARIVRPIRGGGASTSSLVGSTPIKSKNNIPSSNLYANTSKISQDYPSPLTISNASSLNSSSSLTGSTNSSSTITSPQPKLNSESSGFFNLFRKKSTSPIQPPQVSNSSSSANSSGANSNNASTSVTPTPLSPIPMQLNSYTAAVPTSPLNSTNNSPPSTTPSSND